MKLDPHRVVRALVVPYGVGAAVACVPLLRVAGDRPLEVLAIWALAGATLGLVCALIVASVAWRVERLPARGPSPAPHRWAEACLWLAMAAHWAPMSVLSLAAVAGGATGDARLGTAGAGVLALGVAGLAWLRFRAVERRLQARIPEVYTHEPRGLVGATNGVGMPWVLAGLYGLSALAASLTWFGWSVSVAWPNGVGALALSTWSLVGLGAAALFAGKFGGLMWRADRRGSAVGKQVQLAGLVLASHWIVWFALALSPAPFAHVDAQHSVLWSSYLWVILGTALAALGVERSRAVGAD